MLFEITCPRCRDEVSLDLEDVDETRLEVPCPECRVSVGLPDLEIDPGEPVVTGDAWLEFECPENPGWSTEVEVTTERGKDDFTCEHCPHDHRVTWDDWGATVVAVKPLVYTLLCPIDGMSVEVEETGGWAECDDCGAGMNVEVDPESGEMWVETGEYESFECPLCDEEYLLNYVDLFTWDDEGEEEMECERCGAVLEVSWEWGGKVLYDQDGERREPTVTVEVVEWPSLELDCPVCDEATLEVERRDAEEGRVEIECARCTSVVEVAWDGWAIDGMDAEHRVLHRQSVDFECPRCASIHVLEVLEAESGRRDVDCPVHGALLEVDWSEWAEMVDVRVVDPRASFEYECPECGHAYTFDDVDEESGGDSVVCDICNSGLEIEWGDWGDWHSVESLAEAW